MINHHFAEEALSKFYGCDSDETQAGSKQNPSVWLFGIEHGTYKSKHDENLETKELVEDEDYSVKTQMKWPYNQKAFKLLASMSPRYGAESMLNLRKNTNHFFQEPKASSRVTCIHFPAIMLERGLRLR